MVQPVPPSPTLRFSNSSSQYGTSTLASLGIPSPPREREERKSPQCRDIAAMEIAARLPNLTPSAASVAFGSGEASMAHCNKAAVFEAVGRRENFRTRKAKEKAPWIKRTNVYRVFVVVHGQCGGSRIRESRSGYPLDATVKTHF